MANVENLKMIRFVTGEEIIAEITSDSGTVLTVKNPIRVIVVPSKTDPKNPQVAFAPYAEFTDDKEFTFNKMHVVTTYSPINQFVNQYNSVYGGLVVPDSQIIKP
mgnify:CR=1 FL=1